MVGESWGDVSKSTSIADICKAQQAIAAIAARESEAPHDYIVWELRDNFAGLASLRDRESTSIEAEYRILPTEDA